MALTQADIEEFITLVQSNAELRERVRRALIDDAFERIAATLAQSAEDDRVFREEMRRFEADTRQFTTDTREFTTDMRKFEARSGEFEADMRSFEGEMRQFQEATTDRFDAIDRRFNRIDGEIGNLRGEHFEHSFRLHFAPHVATRFSNVRPITFANHEPVDQAFIQGRITPEDWDDLNHADAAMLVRDRNAPERGDIIAIFELSRVVDANDVRRASRRAAVLALAGFAAVACVAGEAITADARTLAESQDVEVLVRKRDPVEV